MVNCGIIEGDVKENLGRGWGRRMLVKRILIVVLSLFLFSGYVQAQEPEKRGKWYLLADLDEITIHLDTENFTSNYSTSTQKPDVFEFDYWVRIVSWNEIMDGYAHHKIRTNFKDVREMQILEMRTLDFSGGITDTKPDLTWKLIEKQSLYDVISARLLMYNIKINNQK